MNKKAFDKKILFFLVSITLLCTGGWYVGIYNLSSSFLLFNAKTIFLIFLCLTINLYIVSFRLHRLITYFYTKLPFGVVMKANVQGNFASLFVISLFGQVVGRQQVMTTYGINPVLIAMMTAIERAGIAVVSGLLCFVGAYYLLDISQINKFLGTTTLTQFLCAVLLALFFSVWLGRSAYESKMILKLLSKKSVKRTIETFSITLFAQMFMLSSFVIAGKELSPDIHLSSLFAAAAVTSFAASLPISVNGWGIRELTAVFTFGHIGMPEHYALAISILIGVCSSALILVIYPLILVKDKHRLHKEFYINHANEIANHDSSYNNRVAVWFLSSCVSILIFFQLFVLVNGSLININFADAFALLSLAAVVSFCLFYKVIPRWKIKHFNTYIIVISCLIFLAFIHGAMRIGITQWALTGRVFGWFVLLGYLSLGMLVVSNLGKRGIRRIIEMLSMTACVVIVIKLLLRYLVLFGVFNNNIVPLNFEGYSGNRNAFAFLLIVCSILLMSQSFFYERIKNHFNFLEGKKITRKAVFIVLHGIIIGGIMLTGSKAGLLTELFLLIVVYKWCLSRRDFVVISCIFSACFWILSILIVPNFIKLILTGSLSLSIVSINHYSNEYSIIERWETIVHGLRMWLDNPLFGAGLGVFIENSTLWFRHPIVIHCTPVWLLAEFGLVGSIIFLAIFISVFRQSLKIRNSNALILILLAFFVFGLFHEIFNQRIFWFSIGLCLPMSLALLRNSMELN